MSKRLCRLRRSGVLCDVDDRCLRCRQVRQLSKLIGASRLLAGEAECLTHNRRYFGICNNGNDRIVLRNTVIVGNYNVLHGSHLLVIGHHNAVFGDYNRTRGKNNVVSGRRCTNYDTGSNGMAFGGNSVRIGKCRNGWPKENFCAFIARLEGNRVGRVSVLIDRQQFDPNCAPSPREIALMLHAAR